jgi:hypothetical protein
MDADAGRNHFASERMKVERRDVEFEVEGGDRLAAGSSSRRIGPPGIRPSRWRMAMQV